MEKKNKILYVMKILIERTDESHPLSTNQIIEILNNEYGIPVHRTTIPKDIAVLKEFGFDIITIHSTQSKYFIGSRRFELPELKLLIDAVESSKFITSKKSKELILKLETLTSKGNVEKLKRNNYLTNIVKPDNEQVYYIVDVINDAINHGKQIAFKYYEYTALKEKVLRHDGEVYVISPYNLVWKDDFYYLIGFSEKRNKVVSFRVDRIATIPDILEDDCIQKPEDFNLEEFVKTVFLMYGGSTVTVDLLCDNKLMKTMIDRFGENVKTFPYDASSFHIITDVEVSRTFYGWVFGFGGDVKILSPECVKRQYRNMLSQSLDEL